jgi:hypothetical protein
MYYYCTVAQVTERIMSRLPVLVSRDFPSVVCPGLVCHRANVPQWTLSVLDGRQARSWGSGGVLVNVRVTIYGAMPSKAHTIDAMAIKNACTYVDQDILVGLLVAISSMTEIWWTS